MDWKNIKERAKVFTKKNLGDFWKVYIIIVVIMFIGTAIIKISVPDAASPVSGVATFILGLIEAPFILGMLNFILKIVRGEEYSVKDVFSKLNLLVQIIVMNFLVALLTGLGMFLFIIPGIVLALAYSMTSYIMADGEEQPIEVMRKSREMMKGYKTDFFLFTLSFLGWILLCILVVPIVWVVPYIQYSMTIYYDDLKNLQEK